MPEAYRPSNGTEGLHFQDTWCERCQRDIANDCPILGATMMFDVDEPSYPPEWIYGDSDRPVCTAFTPRRDPSDMPAPCPGTLDLFGGSTS